MAYFSFSQTDVVQHSERSTCHLRRPGHRSLVTLKRCWPPYAEPGKFKVVSDPVHQFIPLDDAVVKIIDVRLA